MPQAAPSQAKLPKPSELRRPRQASVRRLKLRTGAKELRPHLEEIRAKRAFMSLRTPMQACPTNLPNTIKHPKK